jgi:hypothetical protein
MRTLNLLPQQTDRLLRLRTRKGRILVAGDSSWSPSSTTTRHRRDCGKASGTRGWNLNHVTECMFFGPGPLGILAATGVGYNRGLPRGTGSPPRCCTNQQSKMDARRVFLDAEAQLRKAANEKESYKQVCSFFFTHVCNSLSSSSKTGAEMCIPRINPVLFFAYCLRHARNNMLSVNRLCYRRREWLRGSQKSSKMSESRLDALPTGQFFLEPLFQWRTYA